MEGGKRPEFFTLQWANEKILREWKEALDSQVSYCKEHNLRCGENPVTFVKKISLV